MSTRDGSWTHTRIAANRILSPACLPVPPPGWHYFTFFGTWGDLFGKPCDCMAGQNLPTNDFYHPCGQKKSRHASGPFGAEDQARTGHPDLGKVVLYQMSYFRIKKNNWILAISLQRGELLPHTFQELFPFFGSAKIRVVFNSQKFICISDCKVCFQAPQLRAYPCSCAYTNHSCNQLPMRWTEKLGIKTKSGKMTPSCGQNLCGFRL